MSDHIPPASAARAWDEHLNTLAAIFKRRHARQTFFNLPLADAHEQVYRAVQKCASAFIEAGLTPENVSEAMFRLTVSEYVHVMCGEAYTPGSELAVPDVPSAEFRRIYNNHEENKRAAERANRLLEERVRAKALECGLAVRLSSATARETAPTTPLASTQKAPQAAPVSQGVQITNRPIFPKSYTVPRPVPTKSFAPTAFDHRQTGRHGRQCGWTFGDASAVRSQSSSTEYLLSRISDGSDNDDLDADCEQLDLFFRRKRSATGSLSKRLKRNWRQ